MKLFKKIRKHLKRKGALGISALMLANACAGMAFGKTVKLEDLADKDSADYYYDTDYYDTDYYGTDYYGADGYCGIDGGADGSGFMTGGVDNQYTKDILGYQLGQDKFYAITMKWGNMVFVYDNGTYNPETGKLETSKKVQETYEVNKFSISKETWEKMQEDMDKLDKSDEAYEDAKATVWNQYTGDEEETVPLDALKGDGSLIEWEAVNAWRYTESEWGVDGLWEGMNLEARNQPFADYPYDEASLKPEWKARKEGTDLGISLDETGKVKRWWGMDGENNAISVENYSTGAVQTTAVVNSNTKGSGAIKPQLFFWNDVTDMTDAENLKPGLWTGNATTMTSDSLNVEEVISKHATYVINDQDKENWKIADTGNQITTALAAPTNYTEEGGAYSGENGEFNGHGRKLFVNVVGEPQDADKVPLLGKKADGTDDNNNVQDTAKIGTITFTFAAPMM